MRTTRKFSAGIIGAAALALGMLVSAQTAPPERPKPPTPPPTTPPSTTPPRTPPPTTPPTTTPPRTPSTTPPPAKPETPGATAAVRPHGTDALAATLAEDTIQFYKDADFKDTVTQIDGVAKSNKANGPIDLKE